MACQYCGGGEKEREMEGLCRFHGFQLSMPKRPISHAKDQSIGGCHIWAPEDEFFGRLLGLSSYCPGHRGSGEDDIYIP